jgi:hypothetical protein
LTHEFRRFRLSFYARALRDLGHRRVEGGCMKAIIKRAVMHAYCRGWITSMTVVKAFSLFDLRNH